MNRRQFLERAAVAAGAAMVPWPAATGPSPQRASSRLPWYRRTYLWGQTNITEKDPVRYDIGWWRDYWKRTAVQGVIVNARGSVAYHPPPVPPPPPPRLL